MKKGMLCLTIVLSVLFALISVGSAFAAFPGDISKNKPINVYTISTGNDTPSYGSQNTSSKIGTIYASDDLRVFRIEGAWVYLDYPVTGGRKEAWVQLSAITANNWTHVASTARAQVTTYRRSSTANSYGYVSPGDAVTAIAAGNGFVQLIYPISGGYKMGWVTQANYDAYIKPATPTPTPTPTQTLTLHPTLGSYKPIGAYTISRVCP